MSKSWQGRLLFVASVFLCLIMVASVLMAVDSWRQRTQFQQENTELKGTVDQLRARVQTITFSFIAPQTHATYTVICEDPEGDGVYNCTATGPIGTTGNG